MNGIFVYGITHTQMTSINHHTFFLYLPHGEHYLFLLTGRSVREHPFAWFY